MITLIRNKASKAAGYAVSVMALLMAGTIFASTAQAAGCNGLASNCGKRLNEVAFAGTHNSGAGYRGNMYYWGTFMGGTAAAASLYRNQNKSFAAQLDGGIRYFDIDTTWVEDHPVGTQWWKPEGAWINHSNTYAGPVRDLFLAVDYFLNGIPILRANTFDTFDRVNAHPNEVVIIEFNNNVRAKNSSVKRQIANDILRMIKERFSGKTIVRDRSKRWPKLGDSLASGRNVAIFMNSTLSSHLKSSEKTDLERYVTPFKYEKQYKPDLQKTVYGEELISNIYCGKPDSGVSCKCSNMVKMAENMCGTTNQFVRLTVAVPGAAIALSADRCSKQISAATQKCSSKRGGKAVNFVMIDRFGSSSLAGGKNDLINAVNKLNK